MNFYQRVNRNSKWKNQRYKVLNKSVNIFKKKEKSRCTKEAKDYENWPGRLENGQNELLEINNIIIEFTNSMDRI